MNVKFPRTGLYPGDVKKKDFEFSGCRRRIDMIFEMGTLYGSNITLQSFGQHVLTKNVFFFVTFC